MKHIIIILKFCLVNIFKTIFLKSMRKNEWLSITKIYSPCIDLFKKNVYMIMIKTKNIPLLKINIIWLMHDNQTMKRVKKQLWLLIIVHISHTVGFSLQKLIKS